MNKLFTIIALALIMPMSLSAAGKGKLKTDREVWVDIMYQMAEPVMKNMAEGKLQQVMDTTGGNKNLELSPTWDNRNKRVAYMEAFGRLLAGLAPWLNLPDDDTPESAKRKQLREWTRKAIINAVDPNSPDRLGWESGGQTLVDGAYVVEGLYRGYDSLWVPLPQETKDLYIKEIKGLRRYDPPYTNWFLFVGMEECFLMYAGADYDAFRIKTAMSKVEEWYIGDGIYSDGPSFAFDYYNSFVIQPMYLECLEMISARQGGNSYLIRAKDGKRNTANNRVKEVRKRMQKWAVILERFISPEGTYPVFGRSTPYRLAAMQPLALMAWYQKLPSDISNGQVRAALTKVMHRMFDQQNNYNEGGFLTIGFCGSQKNIADWYTNNGSLYMTSLAFMPLGLPADSPFWTDEAQPWTQVKAWGGQPFPKDHRWADDIQTKDKW